MQTAHHRRLALKGIASASLIPLTARFAPIAAAATFNTVELEEFGGSAVPASGGTAIVDNSPALNAALSAISNSGTIGTIQLRKGYYYFLSKPNLIATTANIVGHSPSTTYLMKAYQESTVENGLLHFTVPGCRVSRLQISASTVGGTNYIGGCAIALVSYLNSTDPSLTTSPDWFTAEDVVVSGVPSGWHYGLFANGGNRPLTPAAGIRDLAVRGSSFFNASLDSVRLHCVNNASIEGAFFQGTGGQASIHVSGVSTNKSNNIRVSAHHLNTLRVSNANAVTVIHSASSTLVVEKGVGVDRLAVYPGTGNYL